MNSSNQGNKGTSDTKPVSAPSPTNSVVRYNQQTVGARASNTAGSSKNSVVGRN